MRRILIASAVLLFVGMTSTVVMADQTLSVNFANAPTGTHFVTGTPTPECTVTATTVTCPTQAFELAGVGNTNATATLAATYSATVQCRNRGGNIVEVHSQRVTVTSTSGALSPKNGRLTVPPITAVAPTEEQFEAMATCPNPNWTAEILPGSITLISFTYTVTFAGFMDPAITITGNDP
jgi:hypothetical protein